MGLLGPKLSIDEEPKARARPVSLHRTFRPLGAGARERRTRYRVLVFERP
jgi:hypothetical protein